MRSIEKNLAAILQQQHCETGDREEPLKTIIYLVKEGDLSPFKKE